ITMPCESRTKSFKICRCICKWRCQCLIPRERKPKPPFGSSSKRDDIIGLHPKFYSGEVDSPPVGLYDPRPIDTKITATSWKKQVELEEFSATMGGRLLDKYVLERSLMKTGLGPGTHEISQWPEISLQRTCKTIRRDIGFGTVPLFKPAHVCTNPGPGRLTLRLGQFE
ncbi:uncharacterized protein LOC128886789, partial [Hylaeus anthracinus]|uniref:uncharacterized protein LOC128886789 n=1 Tax=Hylaeus anthracinus TaxID=313031 RepID=UPI0023B93B92